MVSNIKRIRSHSLIVLKKSGSVWNWIIIQTLVLLSFNFPHFAMSINEQFKVLGLLAATRHLF